MPAPPPSPPDDAGFGVVAEQLRTLARRFEDLGDAAAGYTRGLSEISISGDQTGRCAPDAGDALKAGLQHLVANLNQFGNRALHVCDALDSAASNYENADETGAQYLRAAGAEL